MEFVISENGVSGPEEDLKGVKDAVRDLYRIRYYRWALERRGLGLGHQGCAFDHAALRLSHVAPA